MNLPARSIAIGSALAAAAFVLDRLGAGLTWICAALVLMAFVGSVLPWIGVRWLDHAIHFVRAMAWRQEEGRYHAFRGLGMRVEDDGRHVWLLAEDLQRLRRSSEPLDVVAARHSARWRHDEHGALWLRADAVAEQLAQARDALDPGTIRLRRYIERELLFPAAERRRRAGSS
jgi:hypothetical protein